MAFQRVGHFFQRVVIFQRVIDFNGYQITTKPKGLRKYLWDIFPYWQGSTPKFEVTLKALRNIPSTSRWRFILFDKTLSTDNPETLEWIDEENIKEGDIIPRIVKTVPISFTGDMQLVIDDRGTKKTIYSFHVTHRSWLALAIIAGILAGIIASLGNALFRLLE